MLGSVWHSYPALFWFVIADHIALGPKAIRIYTKTGDDGTTGLFGGARVEKDAPRIEAIGAVDELNAVLGLALVDIADEDIAAVLTRIQNDLFYLGADLATPIEDGVTHGKLSISRLTAESAQLLELSIDHFETELNPLKQFILPGGCRLASNLHFSRTVCRRAERECVALAASETINSFIVIYLNRLSDLLFVMARVANKQVRMSDIPWQP
jgi:cob(I)alamin adenosyltransferase